MTRSGRRCCPVCSNTRDRKSTRLNSSHMSISYAVFCLKKKKKKKEKQQLESKEKISDQHHEQSPLQPPSCYRSDDLHTSVPNQLKDSSTHSQQHAYHSC